MSNTRYFLQTELSPSCCEGAPFLPDHVIQNVPKALHHLLTDREWSSAMSHLQSITMDQVPSNCTRCALPFCFGVCGCFCLYNKYSTLVDRLSVAIKQLNAEVFNPKGMHIALQAMRASVCSAGTPVLVIALTPEESMILRTEKAI